MEKFARLMNFMMFIEFVKFSQVSKLNEVFEENMKEVWPAICCNNVKELREVLNGKAC